MKKRMLVEAKEIARQWEGRAAEAKEFLTRAWHLENHERPAREFDAAQRERILNMLEGFR